jgi:hypothetical protein
MHILFLLPGGLPLFSDKGQEKHISQDSGPVIIEKEDKL